MEIAVLIMLFVMGIGGWVIDHRERRDRIDQIHCLSLLPLLPTK